MPDEAGTVNMSPDNQYILATGTYKPRVKCYEVNNLSLKFERCFDSEVVKNTILSEDYSKMVCSKLCLVFLFDLMASSFLRYF